MNKLYFLLAVVFLSSCANKKQSERERFISDSLRNEFIKDSIANDIKNDSLALIAWGDTRFGITKDECLNTYSFGGGSDYGSSIKMNVEKKWDFKDAFGLELLSDIEAFFGGKNNNELFFIQIKSYDEYASKFDDLKKECNIFKLRFSEIYGVPTFEDDINFFEMEDGEDSIYAHWEIRSNNNGIKHIFIVLGEINSGSEYYYRVVVRNELFPKTKYELTDEEKKIEEEKQDRLNKVKNNSF